jgi:hypothetical protein
MSTRRILATPSSAQQPAQGVAKLTRLDGVSKVDDFTAQDARIGPREQARIVGARKLTPAQRDINGIYLVDSVAALVAAQSAVRNAYRYRPVCKRTAVEGRAAIARFINQGACP